ncbi:MAG: ATP-binding protein [Planctomycetota bacterium]
MSDRERSHTVSIRARIAVVVFGAVAIYVGLDQWLNRVGFGRAFDNVTTREAREALEAATDPVLARAAALDALATAFATGLEVSSGVLVELGADVAIAVGGDGEVAAAHYAAPEARARMIGAFPNEQWLEGHPLLRLAAQDPAGAPLRGLLEIADRMVVFAARQPADGPFAGGMVVAAEELSDDRLAALLSHAGARGELQVGRRAQLEGRESPTVETTFAVGRGGERVARGPLTDAIGRPVGTVEAPAETGLAELRADLERSELLSAVGVALLFPLVLLTLLQLVVTGPLSILTKRVERIANDDDAAARLELERGDEIGTLAAAFDGLLGKLEESRRASLQVARLSGRADVAADVAHSAGNALNSVSVASQLARQRLKRMGLDDLRAIHAALVENREGLDRYLAEDEQGRHLLPFLESSIQALGTQVDGLADDTQDLEASVDECIAILARLRDEGSPRDHGSEDRVCLADLARRAAVERGAVPGLARGDAETRVDAQRVRDVLAAVLENAVEASAAAGLAPDSVTVQTSREGDHVEIVVADQGVGFEADAGARLFRQGFTTKGGGVGLGLHRAALLANEIGGDLTVTSPGAGLGATAVLRVPVVHDAARAAA